MSRRTPHAWERAVHWLASKEVPRDLFYRPPAGLGAPGAGDLCFRWLGAAGFEVEAHGRVMLLDPYVSRPGLRETLFHPLSPDDDAIAEHIHQADLVVAGHSHHDHAMDVGAIARLTGARVYASDSALHAARLYGAPEELLDRIHAGRTFTDGPFTVQVLRSVHGKVFAGRIPLPGKITETPTKPLRLKDWKVGSTFGLHVTVGETSFFHLGSADFVESALQDVQCDVLLLCIIGRQGCPDFTRRILQTLRPKVVLPCHWDNFLLPFDHPARVIRRCKMERFLEEVEECDVPCEVALLDFFGEYRFPLRPAQTRPTLPSSGLADAPR